jgi:hypothetical protein
MLKELIFSGWDTSRSVKVLIGLLLAGLGQWYQEPIVTMFGAIITVQGITRTGCFSGGGCQLPPKS